MITALQNQLLQCPAGTVVGVRCGFYSHVGLLGEVNPFQERRVISLSSSGYREEALSSFVGQREFFVEGYFGNLPAWLVLQRARQLRGKKYSWLGYNCDHFVRDAHAVTVESPQLQRWGLAAFAALAVAAAGA